MTIYEYNTSFNHRNSQEDLQKLAKNIFAHGKITSIEHNSYGTNNPEQTIGDDFIHVNDGRVCYVVTADGFPCTYYIHMYGTKVTNITECIDN